MRRIGNTDTMTGDELGAELQFARDHRQYETERALLAILNRRTEQDK